MAPTSRSAWPPVFEDNGSAYVFDGRSGMFFEPESNFFYDPKTKLYYGNDAKKYFRFDFGHNRLPKFVPIPENNGLGEELLPLRTADGAAKSGKTISSEQGKKTGKQPANNIHKRPADARISINIKTSILSERKDQATFVDRKRNENLDHIARWQGQKNQIKKVPEPEMESAAPTKDTTTKTSSPPPPLYMGDKVICVLCRRRFPSLAALERHEKLSQLHKVNVANQAEANNTMNALTSAKKNETERDEEQCYVDRAAKRRCLHNGTPDSASSYQHSASFVTDESTSSDTSLPALGEQNVGHQLFQKMMSKTDSSRVRDRDAMEIQNRLNSEWTRIEAISSQAAHAHRLNLLQKEKWGIGTL
jgi:RNA-binding protein 5/10